MNLGAFAVHRRAPEADRASRRSLDTFAGLGRREPLLGVLMTLFLLSLTGIPPTAGFFAKAYVILAAVQAGGPLTVLAVIAVLNAAVAAFYYLRIIVYMFMRDPATEAPAAPPRRAAVGRAGCGDRADDPARASSRRRCSRWPATPPMRSSGCADLADRRADGGRGATPALEPAPTRRRASARQRTGPGRLSAASPAHVRPGARVAGTRRGPRRRTPPSTNPAARADGSPPRRRLTSLELVAETPTAAGRSSPAADSTASRLPPVVRAGDRPPIRPGSGRGRACGQTALDRPATAASTAARAVGDVLGLAHVERDATGPCARRIATAASPSTAGTRRGQRLGRARAMQRGHHGIVVVTLSARAPRRYVPRLEAVVTEIQDASDTYPGRDIGGRPTGEHGDGNTRRVPRQRPQPADAALAGRAARPAPPPGSRDASARVPSKSATTRSGRPGHKSRGQGRDGRRGRGRRRGVTRTSRPSGLAQRPPTVSVFAPSATRVKA